MAFSLPDATSFDKPQSHTANQPVTRHPKDNESKATSSPFRVKMIAKLEWTQSTNVKMLLFLLGSG